MTAVSVNQAASPTSLDTHVKGTMSKRERRQILVLVMAILGPIQRLMGDEAPRRSAWHDEVDKLRALEA